jgi:hypothetical protein
MNKRLLMVLVIILLLFPATVFAGNLLGLSIGASAILLEEIPLEGDIDFDPADIDMEDLYIGGEVRFNISLLELSLQILPINYGEMDDVFYLHAYVLPGIGLSIEMFDLVDLGVTIGTWGEAAASTGGYFETSFYEFEDLPLFFKASVDFNLGFLSIGGFAYMFPELTIGQVINSDFEPGTLELPSGAYIGVSALINLL